MEPALSAAVKCVRSVDAAGLSSMPTGKKFAGLRSARTSAERQPDEYLLTAIGGAPPPVGRVSSAVG